MLEIGSVIDGKYKILSVIGRGGMSVVYMAINEKANKTWAVKEVRKNAVIDFEAVKRSLVVETNMLKKLHHPNLPSIVDVIESSDVFLIVMDYVEGNSLGQALEEYGALPEAYVIAWARQLCDVLGYLHTRKPPIIYRDMKPGNIMLRPDGRLSLIDFGTAREFKAAKNEDTTCLGTVGYAAPEQFGNVGQTDARTDIYGLGATLYHLVTGKNPSEPPYEMKPIREIDPTFSQGLERIILKCTEKNPEDRYQSAAEMMYALDHIEEIDDSFRRRQRWKLGLFLLAASLAAGFFATGFLSVYSADRQAAGRYEDLLMDARQMSDLREREAAYVRAIAIPDMGGNKEAYLALIEGYKEDGNFTTEEAEELESLIRKHRNELFLDLPGYIEVCYETGKLFWYYYSYGDGGENRVTRAKSAAGWFETVLSLAPKEDPKRGMAEAYATIGAFYRDIASNIAEGKDNGSYAPLFQSMESLIDSVASDENESEMVRFELMNFSEMTLMQYADKFRRDGISEERTEALLSLLWKLGGMTEASNDTTDALKKELLGRKNDAEEAIRTAYGAEAGA